MGGGYAPTMVPMPSEISRTGEVSRSGELKVQRARLFSPFTRAFILAMHDVERSLNVTSFTYDDYGRWSELGKPKWSRYAAGMVNEVKRRIPREDCEALGKLYQETLPNMFGIPPLGWATTENWLKLGGHDIDTFRSLLEACRTDQEFQPYLPYLQVTQTPLWMASQSDLKRQALTILEQRMARISKLRRIRVLIEDWQDEQG